MLDSDSELAAKYKKYEDDIVRLEGVIGKIINRISDALMLDWTKFDRSEIGIDEILDSIVDKIGQLR